VNVKIQLMLSEGCSHKDAARALLNEAISDTGVEAEIEEIMVRTDEDARIASVIGSPSIKVEGLDIEYADREPDETSNGCRYYNTPAGWKPLPEKGMIVRGIERARGRS
jgi:hypothetical protein